jgi:hypothetical protein
MSDASAFRPCYQLQPFLQLDTKFVELEKCLCEVRAWQYWRVENLVSFDDFLERRFPGSRGLAYYLMSIHENLPPQVRKSLKDVGWAKGIELAKLARKQGQRFESANLVAQSSAFTTRTVQTRSRERADGQGL